jgi:prepilin-type N-terminal cleavage/methylation domain-containing protein
LNVGCSEGEAFVEEEIKGCAMKRRQGFTLLELLVVIAIISVVVALTIPILHKVRRKGTVLTSPIVYTGENHGVYLTNLGGGEPFQVSAPSRSLYPDARWSPSGERLGFDLTEPSGKVYSAILDPLADRLVKYPVIGRFHGWADANTFVEWAYLKGPVFYFRDANTGALLRTITLARGQEWDPLSPTPLACQRGVIVTAVASSVVLLKKDLSVAKWIYSLPATPPYYIDPVNPQIDPSGEWAAWTTHEYKESGGSSKTFVVFKHVNDPPSKLPTILDTGLSESTFCDWTENGNLLITGPPTTNPKSLFNIYDKLFVFERSN